MPDQAALAYRHAPTELASAERMILHYTAPPRAHPAPTELVSAERMILHYTPRIIKRACRGIQVGMGRR